MPIKKNKISFTLDLSKQIKKIKPSKRKEVTELIGVTVIDAMGEYLDKGSSPVSKGSYKKKMADGKTISDLYETGAMLGNLKFINTKEKVEFKITDTTEKLKAFNHNTGDTLPTRQFLPDDEKGEKFKRSIMQKVKGIINDASED